MLCSGLDQSVSNRAGACLLYDVRHLEKKQNSMIDVKAQPTLRPMQVIGFQSLSKSKAHVGGSDPFKTKAD